MNGPVSGQNIQIMWKYLKAVLLPMAVAWKKSGTNRDLFASLWKGYCVTGGNFSFLMKKSGVRHVACLPLPLYQPVCLPESVIHWRVLGLQSENRG